MSTLFIINKSLNDIARFSAEATSVSKVSFTATKIRAVEMFRYIPLLMKVGFSVSLAYLESILELGTNVSAQVDITIYRRIRELEDEIRREWPDVERLIVKVKCGEPLTDVDREWLRELSEVTGWDPEDIEEDLRNIDVDPSERTERYHKLFEKYLKEAIKHVEKGDTQQAAEKLWGAITALVKLYAALKRVPIIHWSRSRIEKFVRNNVEEELKPLFIDLLDKGSVLHEHFYEGHMDPENFRIRWKQALQLIEEIRRRLQI